MLNAILACSIRNRVLVVGIALAVAAGGGFALRGLPIDAVPDITNNQVQINTSVSGLTPIDVERQVTFPIETAMAGIRGLEYTRSLSRSGFSQVTVVFAEGVDSYFARQQVAERLVDAREALPAGVEPRMGPLSTGLGEVYMYAVDFTHRGGVGAVIAPDDEAGWKSDGSYLTPEGESLRSAAERITWLRTVHDWQVKPQLRTVPGVAGVDVLGGYTKQYVVEPDPARLATYGLSAADVRAAIERNNQSVGSLPVEINGEGHVVRSDGRVQGVDDLAAIVLASHAGTPVRLRDVATVGIGREVRTGAATLGGDETVVGTALMLIGGNSRTVARDVHQRVQAIATALPADVTMRTVYDRSSLVDATIRTVRLNLIEGAALVIAVLFLLLGNLRGALIAAAVIPLSMLYAAIGMRWLHISGNLMSLGALDFGIIVDTAVIIVENGLRRLGQRQREFGRLLTLPERLREVYRASVEMRQATLFGEAIIVVVYIPVLTLSGIEGKMFQPMALTVILALAGAFVLSLSFVPAMLALLVRGRVAEHDNRLMSLARSAYAPVLAWALRARWLVVGAATAAFAGSLWLGSRLGQEFIPKLDEGDLAVQSVRIASTGMEQSTAMQRQVERAVLALPEVAWMFSKTGTAEAAFDPMPPNVSDAFIMLKPRSEWPNPGLGKPALRAKVEDAINRIPGQRYIFTQPIELRFNELISGVRGDLAVKIFGDNFAGLLFTAGSVADVLKTVPGASEVSVEQVEGLPALVIDIDRAACARLGLNVADIQDVVAAALGGADAGQVFEGDRRFAIVVRLPDATRRDVAALRRLPIALPVHDDADHRDAGMAKAAGGRRHVPLSTVASIEISEGLNQVSRENGKRRIVVQANVRGRDLGSFVDEAKRVVAAKITLPAGAWIGWGGQYENLVAAKQRLSLVVPACLLLIGGLLYATFSSLRYAALVFTGVPLALSGGIVALWLRSMPFSISAAVGFIALSGVDVLNGLVLVSCINQLRAAGTALDAAVVDGCLQRLRPVLMTALVASLGFVPMALAGGQGAEVQKPLATVVIGGIVSSTLLTLIVLPALYRLCHRRNAAWPPAADADVDLS